MTLKQEECIMLFTLFVFFPFFFLLERKRSLELSKLSKGISLVYINLLGTAFKK